VLAAGARGAVCVDLQVLGIDLDIYGVLHQRRHLHPGEGGVAARLRVERRDPHQPVHPLLGREQAIGVLAARDERGRLDPGLLPRRRLLQLDLHAAPLGPAHLHAQQHLGPVLRVGTARARVDRDYRVAAVVLAAEQARLLELGEPGLDRGALLVELSGDRLVLRRHLLERLEIVHVALERAERLEPPGHRGVLGRHRRRVLLVVPEAGRLHLLLQVAYSAFETSRVKDSPRAASAGRGGH
jgi:hypothetical protein